METLGGILLFAAMAASVLGVLNLIKPQAWMKIKKRRYGALMILGSLFATGLGGSMLPVPEDSAVKAVADQTDTNPIVRDGVTQEEFEVIWTSVKNYMARCDGPLTAAGTALESGDVYAAYGPTKSAAEACEAAWLDMGKIRIPKSAKGDAKTALKDALDTCNTAIYLKREALKQLQTVLDGDVRPSIMEDTKDKLERGGGLSTKCTFDFLAAATQSKLMLPELQEAFDQAKEK
ncbi:hypothetical protein GCM10009093_21590 [Brevundimonas terrae]|uniref:Uncharacterized protein n=1 Tax=Brevundimonas terrae TaxID=363631 RepID=A0ABN0YGN9_9CAUL|nr:hypothetical protein [Brevundimonas terrae]NIJ26906.1 hypothetical protein [Brevundimonas terrae]